MEASVLDWDFLLSVYMTQFAKHRIWVSAYCTSSRQWYFVQWGTHNMPSMHGHNPRHFPKKLLLGLQIQNQKKVVCMTWDYSLFWAKPASPIKFILWQNQNHELEDSEWKKLLIWMQTAQVVCLLYGKEMCNALPGMTNQHFFLAQY